jgi:hypothetical protein
MEKIETILEQLELMQKEKINFALWRESLIAEIDYLINHNFSFLVFILYKLDVQETKIEQSLQNTNIASASILADLMIERSIAKQATKKQFTTDIRNIDADELW